MQQITEAARTSDRALVVVSLPSSDMSAMEAGGFDSDGGTAPEPQSYADSSTFPQETHDAAYMARMTKCYPIHPDVFDALYSSWSTLPRFQRTRSVLSFVAAVVRNLWSGKDEPLIMAGSLPLRDTAVNKPLIEALGDTHGWHTVIDKEVDGDDSLPRRKDKTELCFAGINPSILTGARPPNPNTRVARAVMLGSAPSSVDSAAAGVRGVDTPRVLLGVVTPGENLSLFANALTSLGQSLMYLYSSGSGRYWFDVHPTLRKTAAERAAQYMSENKQVELFDEIEKRLKSQCRGTGAFAVCVCPLSPSVVADEMKARLVILPPPVSCSYNDLANSSAAQMAGNIVLKKSDKADRDFRNTLLFLACMDGDAYACLLRSTAKHLAWQTIVHDVDNGEIGIDTAQAKEMKGACAVADKDVDTAIGGAYCALLVPSNTPQDSIRTGVRGLLCYLRHYLPPSKSKDTARDSAQCHRGHHLSCGGDDQI